MSLLLMVEVGREDDLSRDTQLVDLIIESSIEIVQSVDGLNRVDGIFPNASH